MHASSGPETCMQRQRQRGRSTLPTSSTHGTHVHFSFILHMVLYHTSCIPFDSIRPSIHPSIQPSLLLTIPSPPLAEARTPPPSKRPPSFYTLFISASASASAPRPAPSKTSMRKRFPAPLPRPATPRHALPRPASRSPARFDARRLKLRARWMQHDVRRVGCPTTGALATGRVGSMRDQREGGMRAALRWRCVSTTGSFEKDRAGQVRSGQGGASFGRCDSGGSRMRCGAYAARLACVAFARGERGRGRGRG